MPTNIWAGEQFALGRATLFPGSAGWNDIEGVLSLLISTDEEIRAANPGGPTGIERRAALA